MKFKDKIAIVTGATRGIGRAIALELVKQGAMAPKKYQPFDKNRKGIILDEGAGILILEPLERAMEREANIYAEVLGYGLSCDAFHMTKPAVEGIEECIRKALKDAQISADEIDYISAHGTGTIHNDRAECAAIKRSLKIDIRKSRLVPLNQC